MDTHTFLKSCVELVTVNSVPCSHFDFPAFRAITMPIQEALNITVNAHNIMDHVSLSVEHIKTIIKAELCNKLFCLKFDTASRFRRSVLGINAQFITDGKVVVRSLGMIELTKRHTAENLKQEVIMMLHDYGLNVEQIYTSTTDNGANMIKSVELLKEYQYINEGGENEEHIENTTQPILGSIRCAAHTLQLAVHDVSKGNIKELEDVKNIIKKLRTIPYVNLFAERKKRKPFLDVQTRWSSSYEMIHCLSTQKEFIESIEINIITEELWNFINKFEEAFRPLYQATLKLQSKQLTKGDFYRTWLECELKLEMMEDNIYSAKLLERLQVRKTKLINNNAFPAGIFMDNRFNYDGSEFLNYEEKQKANVNIFY